MQEDRHTRRQQRYFEQQEEEDENNTYVETGYNRQAHQVPDVKTTKPFVKDTKHSDNSWETGSDIAVDSSQNRFVMTKWNSDSRQIVQNYRQQFSHKAKEQYNMI